MNKAIYALVLIALFVLNGCIGTYVQQVNDNMRNNINSFPISANLEDENITYNSNEGGVSKKIEENLAEQCYYGKCNYFICKNTSGFHFIGSGDDAFSDDPYYYLFGQNLTDGSCFIRASNPPGNKEREFAEAYLQLHSKYQIQRVGLSQGFNFYEVNDANPSLKNYIKYPVFVIKGDKNGYRVSPLIKNAVRCFTEKSAIPVFIFASKGVVPKEGKDNTEEIVRWIASLDSTSIIFTVANPEDSPENIRRLVEQFHDIQINCIYPFSTSDPEWKDKKIEDLRCIPGLSLPYNGKSMEKTDEFLTKFIAAYSRKYQKAESPEQFKTSSLFYDARLIVGFPLISTKASKCNGYGLISDAVALSKMYFLAKKYDDIRYNFPVFIQDLTFIEPEAADANKGECKFNELLRKQTYYAMFYNVNTLERYGIINLPNKEYYNIFDPFTYNANDKEYKEYSYWARKEGNNIYPEDKEEYSFFFSYGQEYYNNYNYPKIVYRNGYGTRGCPLKEEKVNIEYEGKTSASEVNMEKLYEVDPSSNKNIYKPVYRCDTCFSYEDPKNFLKDYKEGDFWNIDCMDEFAEISNQQSARFAVDPELIKAIGYTKSGWDLPRQCHIDYVRKTDYCPTPISYSQLKNALQTAGCPTIQTLKYYYDEEAGKCKREDEFLDTKGLEECVPCGLGYMGAKYYPSYLYINMHQEAPDELYLCDVNETYNPFNPKENACVASAELAKDIIKAESFVMDNYKDLKIENSLEGNASIAYFTAYIYEYGNPNSFFDIFNKIKDLRNSKECSSADKEIRPYCCKKTKDDKGNEVWKYDATKENYCCTEDIKQVMSSCDIGKLGKISEVMWNYKSALEECKLCYNPELKENACHYAQIITGSDICNQEEPERDINPWRDEISNDDLRDFLEVWGEMPSALENDE